VEDNQQGIVSAVIAALALAHSGAVPARTVKLLFCADEECGSAYGLEWLMRNRDLFHKNDMALIPDAGDEKGSAIEIAEKNLIWAKFTVKGVQAHGSRPDLGVNAHLAGAELILRLRQGLMEKFSGRDPLFEPEWSSFEPTKKEANVPNINTIPAEDVFYMDMRVLPRYSIEEISAEIDRITGEIEGRAGVKVSREFIQAVESRATPEDAPLVGEIAAAVGEVYGVKARPVGIGGGTVASWLRNAGIEAAVWSRLGGCAHQPNEYAIIANILGDAKVMAALMLNA
jgi:succinyl-diaminopimelate desuccinylase